MTISNIPKCILNYYTSVKVGSYSIGTLWQSDFAQVPILSGHFFFFCKNLAGAYSIGTPCVYIYIYRERCISVNNSESKHLCISYVLAGV